LSAHAEAAALATATVPLCAQWSEEDRIKWATAAEELLGHAEQFAPVLESASVVLAAAKTALSAACALQHTVGQAGDRYDNGRSLPANLADLSSTISAALESLLTAREAFVTTSAEMQRILDGALRDREELAIWDSAVRLLESTEALDTAAHEAMSCAAANRKLERAHLDIDNAVQALLDQRFSDMSDEISRWWNLLRPGDETTFERVERRGTGRRYLDFKANLAVGGGTGVVKDAVAVLGDSQLGALGLSTFLARCIKEQSGFVVLDDPLAGFDDEHRTTFANATLGELVSEGIQVIATTYDRTLCEEIQRTHEHHGVKRFNVTQNEDRTSTIVTPLQDVFEGLHATALSLSRSGVPEHRRTAAEKGRIAAERLAKQIITGYKRRAGSEALISDLDGKTLGPLVDKIAPNFLSADEPGKWQNVADTLNRGNHDGPIPLSNALAQALGDLRRFKKDHKAELGSDWPD